MGKEYISRAAAEVILRRRKQPSVVRQLEALFDTDLAALYRLVRRNLRSGREPLALHRKSGRYWLTSLFDERVKRPTFVGVVNERTTEDDLKAMTGEPD